MLLKSITRRIPNLNFHRTTKLATILRSAQGCGVIHIDVDIVDIRLCRPIVCFVWEDLGHSPHLKSFQLFVLVTRDAYICKPALSSLSSIMFCWLSGVKPVWFQNIHVFCPLDDCYPISRNVRFFAFLMRHYNSLQILHTSQNIFQYNDWTLNTQNTYNETIWVFN